MTEIKKHYWWRTEINEIEKMYENAGIEGYKYPPFTAKKQLELIKWLAEFSDFATFSPDADIDEDTKVKIYGFAFVMRGEKHYYVDDKFEVALAKCFNNLWQDLTEEERKQIKEILE